MNRPAPLTSRKSLFNSVQQTPRQTPKKPPRIVVAGAGAIGCFCGGLWAAAGFPVTLLGRARVLAPIVQNGLRLTDFSGMDKVLPRGSLSCSEDPSVLAGADLVVVAVKSSATAEMANLIAHHASPAAMILSFQNGLGNAALLQDMLPGRDVRAAMVPFNVVSRQEPELDSEGVVKGGPVIAGFHRASSGGIVMASGPGYWGRRLTLPHMVISESEDIAGVQWGKLLINLNNALNALSGLTLVEQLQDRRWRRLMADQMAEALQVMRAAGLRPVSTTPLPAWTTPYILRLPNWAFTRVAAQMLTIDPLARSSMAQDLMLRRATEVDALQGEIQRLGHATGTATPITDLVIRAIRVTEKKQAGLPMMEPSLLVR
ncbi:2-dehydropantoate 2-reductase [Phaeobacter sp. CECT 5382]|uniref:2-dehydropantoate 2-reductase n=1 Tax=Phaeobacter sp. CECT 5382 TaxID=1712645 RepID=UPI0006DBB155|nr:2-dehydropantoate 2-reductase [Phaeobacter sp. CECT 5382]CUH89134.1 2-dehydropantoate 2-reductase [Phaeobacter sp. CECT 5382]